MTIVQGTTPHSENALSKSSKWISLSKGVTLRLEIILSEFDDGCVVKHLTTPRIRRIKIVLGLFIFPNVSRLRASRKFHLSILKFELIPLKLSY